VTVPVPTVGVRPVQVSAPHIDMSGPRAAVTNAAHGVADAAGTVRGRLPDRNHLLYYGGLGALAAIGVMSWPIAAAIGAGVWVAGRAKSATGRKPARGGSRPAARES
jgi:hypothetical protein